MVKLSTQPEPKLTNVNMEGKEQPPVKHPVKPVVAGTKHVKPVTAEKQPPIKPVAGERRSFLSERASKRFCFGGLIVIISALAIAIVAVGITCGLLGKCVNNDDETMWHSWLANTAATRIDFSPTRRERDPLTGTISPDIGYLTALTFLALDHNLITGNIPSQLGLLTKLTALDLSWNQLSGTISSELGLLTKLTILNFGSNQLSGSIPSQLGLLTQLTHLGLNTNQLSGTLPSHLGLLAQLANLSLGSNQLSGTIPSQLGLLTQLTMLYLHTNHLSGAMPSEMEGLNYSFAVEYDDDGHLNVIIEIPAVPAVPCSGPDDPNYRRLLCAADDDHDFD